MEPRVEPWWRGSQGGATGGALVEGEPGWSNGWSRELTWKGNKGRKESECAAGPGQGKVEAGSGHFDRCVCACVCGVVCVQTGRDRDLNRLSLQSFRRTPISMPLSCLKMASIPPPDLPLAPPLRGAAPPSSALRFPVTKRSGKW